MGEVVKAVSMNYELTPEVQDALQIHIQRKLDYVLPWQPFDLQSQSEGKKDKSSLNHKIAS